MDRARIVILTGDGKGKTTSALGMVLRALGHGQRVLLVRFCKTAASGELAVLEALPGIRIAGGDRGMTPPPDHPDFALHAECARKLFACAAAEAAGFDMIVLDEICGVCARGMVGEAEVADFLSALRADQSAVLTGRGAGEILLAAADTVSEIRCVRHGYEQGLPARDGVEK